MNVQKEKGGISMKMNKTVRLLLLGLIFGTFLLGVSVAQAEEEDDLTAIIRIGASGLFRQGNDDISLVRDGGGVELVNAEDVDLGIAPGLDATVGGRYRMFGVELRYLGLHEWSSEDDASAATSWVQYQNPLGTTNPALLDTEYVSNLHSIEVNLRWWPFERLNILAGFRYLMLNEELTIGQNIGPFVSYVNHEIETDNTLLGGQVGIEGIIVRFNDVFMDGDAINLGGSAKVGYFNNHMETDIEVTTPTPYAADESDDEGTFLVEGGATIGYNITSNIAVELRYQMMWIQNIAMAPAQVTHSDPLNGTASTETEDVFYHGPWVGVSISF